MKIPVFRVPEDFMALVVFLRAVNVGGHKTFRPSILAKELAHLGAVNIGAAGTLVVRGTISQTSLRAEILRRLPFKPELVICPARDLIELARKEPFRDASSAKDVRAFVSVTLKPAGKRPALPLEQPVGNQWQVKLIGIFGRFVLSLWRRQGGTMMYPNAVVEKHLGIPATTRSWNTVSAICAVLAKQT
jgi:uncharacterized protein (DUF1697 family)